MHLTPKPEPAGATSSPPPPLTFHDLHLTVPEGSGERMLLRGLNFSLPAGRVTALHGPSGSGKSTLLRACVRMHVPAHGEIRLQERSVLTISPPELRRRVAYLRQFPVFSPGTVEQSLLEPFDYAAEQRDPPSQSTLVDQLNALNQPSSLLDQPTGRLSGGEAQAVAFVRAMLLEPRILLLDEPTASLDPEHEAALVDRVSDWVHEEDRAVLWVTHDRALLERWPESSHRLTDTGIVREDAQ